MANSISASMFKKLKDFIVGRKAGEITPAEANRIQTASYVLSKTEVKKKFSPTYLSLVPELDSEERQIFESAAYYLAKIAINKEKYKQEILDVFNQKIAQKGVNPEFKDYLRHQVQNILSKNN